MYISAQDRAKPESVAHEIYGEFGVEDAPLFGLINDIVVDSDYRPDSKSLIEEVRRLRLELARVEALAFQGLKTTRIPSDKAVYRWVIAHVGALRELSEPFDRVHSFQSLVRLLKWHR